MQVVIRTDASQQIGSGHVARCLALAEELRAKGAEVRFVSRALAGHLLDLIGAAGFKLSRLGAVSPTNGREVNFWFGGKSWEEDAAECIAHLGQLPEPVDWLLVDHYGIDERWEARLRPHVGRIAVIDDLANRRHDCDLLIDQNLRPEGASRYADKVPAHCQLLEGARYAILRREFGRERARLALRDGKVRRILVFFGGMDHLNQTAMALQVLDEEAGRQLWIDVVIGATNPHREEIRQWCAGRGNIHLHCQTSNIAGLMAAADLSVGAGGVTLLERCALGLPTVMIAAAANQTSGAEQLSQQGGAIYLGMHDQVSPQSLRCVLAGVMEMPGLLRTIGSRCQQLVDAAGTERVARQLMLPGLSLRPVGPEDCQRIFEWRNDAQTRRFSHSQEEISFADHQTWFTRSLANPRLLLMMVEAGGSPAGVLRYNLQETIALVSINLAPQWRGYGLGAAILRLGSGWLRSRLPDIGEIRAEILAGNEASARAFADAGYQPYFSTYRYILERGKHGNADFNREA